ncbi:hypothetical protein CKM354_000993500 [Cercospora kikuchii]|uniref:Endonuclease/exonuclease/phosphatase domain-containing protein n=1 Tax=Cercospora kikuchii TaxID=84275 RepID=A0A9P3CQF9_9PEZI|nr:uncharacterized protein CKM354_000993500 [Cercospora kikuchii]GIZ46826.1 hypothetical protein CKM354_000993500 [Cercospora kikuchii]
MSRTISPPPLKRRKLANYAPASDITPPTPLAPDGTQLRVFSWNVNGIASFLQPSITSFFSPTRTASPEAERPVQSSLRDVLRNYDWPTVLQLQEVKISPDDQASQRAVQSAVARKPDEGADRPSYRAFFCLPRDKYNARGFGRKVYGVCSIVREDFVAEFGVEVRGVEWDLEGRFLVCETQVRPGVPKLAIFNCYLVNGTEAPYKDSKSGVIAGTRHDRKLRVHELLQAECRKLESNNVAVILAGDMNVARSRLDGHPNLRTHPLQHCTNRADFETRFLQNSGPDSLHMIDSFRYLHPLQAGYTYYPRHTEFGRSCDRVDLIMLSRSLKPHLISAGIMATPADRGPSDHVPLYAELQFPSSNSEDETMAVNN